MKIECLFDEAAIREAVESLGGMLRNDYAGKNPLLIGCLTGSFVFMADLIRAAAIPLECDFMKVSSYEDKMTAGEIKLILDNTLPVVDRDVIVVEDVVDTGASLRFITERLKSKNPKSLKTCVLFYKESARATLSKESLDYLGFAVPDVFIVGYGIDCAQHYRELKFIGAVS